MNGLVGRASSSADTFVEGNESCCADATLAWVAWRKRTGTVSQRAGPFHLVGWAIRFNALTSFEITHLNDYGHRMYSVYSTTS